jgi:integrase
MLSSPPGIARDLKRKALEKKTLKKVTFPKKPSSDGYYHCYVKDPLKKSGRKQIKAKTLEDLQKKVRTYENGESGDARRTFREAYEILQQRTGDLVKTRERHYSVSNTVSRHWQTYNRFFAGTDFEKLHVDEITELDIEAVCRLNLERYNLRKRAWQSMRTVIKQVMDLSFHRRWTMENNYLRCDFAQFKDMILPDVPIAERAYSQEEMDNVMAFIAEKHRKAPSYLPAYALEMQIIMGLRRGEVPPLRWSDVHDFWIGIEREQITLKPQTGTGGKDSFHIVGHTKNGKNRQFPITREVRDFLDRLKEVHRLYYPGSEYLFPADSPEGVITNSTVYNFYRRMCRALDIPVCQDTVRGTHAFRRNAISRYVNLDGGSIEDAARLFGNSALVAEKHYFTGMDVERFRKVLDGEAGRGQMDLDLEDVIPFFLRLKGLLEEKKVL